MAVPFRKRARRQVRSVVLVAAIRLAALLPRRLAWSLGTLVGRGAWVFARKTRRLALRHLGIAFPEKSEGEREGIARAMFVHLAHVATEVVTIRSYDRDLEAYVEVRNPELLDQLMARGKGLIYVPGHLGNWELQARRIARTGIDNATVAKASHDPRLTRLIEDFRAGGGVKTLWRESPSSGRVIIKTLRSGKALAILIDQDTKVQSVFVPFFGRLASTPRAAAELAIRFGAAVVVGTIHRKGDGPLAGHVVELTEVTYDPAPPDMEAEVVRLTAACTRVLEDAIRRHPAEWVWMHERWKTRPPEGDQRP
ncbi:MAG TPA: lysophospholipid acyltransferase family protein [Anaeromyxobacteraceae bacterium]|nr:lysophospholipid acyltransferase family protein [Anaeromyxobacteraceae bacterium]